MPNREYRPKTVPHDEEQLDIVGLAAQTHQNLTTTAHGGFSYYVQTVVHAIAKAEWTQDNATHALSIADAVPATCIAVWISGYVRDASLAYTIFYDVNGTEMYRERIQVTNIHKAISCLVPVSGQVIKYRFSEAFDDIYLNICGYIRN